VRTANAMNDVDVDVTGVIRRTETAALHPSKLHVARHPLSVSTSSPCSKNMSPHCEPQRVTHRHFSMSLQHWYFSTLRTPVSYTARPYHDRVSVSCTSDKFVA